MRYPEGAYSRRAQGYVTVKFALDEQGNISGVKNIDSIDPELDAEAVRVIAKFGKLNPVKKRGINTPADFKIPLSFKIR